MQVAEYIKAERAWGQQNIPIFPSKFGIKYYCFIAQTFSLQLECRGLKKLNHKIYAFCAHYNWTDTTNPTLPTPERHY